MNSFEMRQEDKKREGSNMGKQNITSVKELERQKEVLTRNFDGIIYALQSLIENDGERYNKNNRVDQVSYLENGFPFAEENLTKLKKELKKIK